MFWMINNEPRKSAPPRYTLRFCCVLLRISALLCCNTFRKTGIQFCTFCSLGAISFIHSCSHPGLDPVSGISRSSNYQLSPLTTVISPYSGTGISRIHGSVQDTSVPGLRNSIRLQESRVTGKLPFLVLTVRPNGRLDLTGVSVQSRARQKARKSFVGSQGLLRILRSADSSGIQLRNSFIEPCLSGKFAEYSIQELLYSRIWYGYRSKFAEYSI